MDFRGIQNAPDNWGLDVPLGANETLSFVVKFARVFVKFSAFSDRWTREAAPIGTIFNVLDSILVSVAVQLFRESGTMIALTSLLGHIWFMDVVLNHQLFNLHVCLN